MNKGITDKHEVRENGWLKRGFRHSWQLYVLLLPSLIWLAAFMYGPMYGLLIAFKDYRAADGIMGSHWAGLSISSNFFPPILLGR